MRLFSDEAVEGFFADGWWTGDTWGDCLRRNVVRFPGRECLVDAPNKAAFMNQQPRRLTWQGLDAAVDACAGVFFRHGLREGDIVGIQLPNSVELVITYLALNRLGAISSPYPVAYRRHEIAQLARIAGVRAIVTAAGMSGRDLRDDITSVLDDLGIDSGLFSWHGNGGGTTLNLEDMLRGAVRSADYAGYLQGLLPHPNDCAIILFTSGTTGVPKGVPRAHGDSLVSASATAAAPGLTFRDVILCPMPMVNGGAISGMFLPWLLTGCKLVQHQPFDLAVFAAQIQTEAVTYSVAPPTILNDMVADDGFFRDHDFSSLRVIGSGSAPLSGWMVSRWESDHGIEVINFFGSTEGLQIFSDADTVPDPALRGRYLPLPGSPRFRWRTEVARRSRARLVDLETGEEITAPGRPGELRVKGPNIFAGYLHGAEGAFDDQGFYRTGDIFERAPDEQDMLILVDRAKDLIIRGGMNISAVEIESLLVSHPKIAEVAAVGKKDERLGERTCIFVVPRNPADPPSMDELIEYLNEEKVAKFKLPEFMELIETMPRNPAGKALKGELRARLNQDGGAAAPPSDSFDALCPATGDVA